MSERIVRQPDKTKTHFANVPAADIERSTFDRSHAYKGTVLQAGDLVPVFWDEVLPGDTFNMRCAIFSRLATPLKPLMDNMRCDVHFFFVPNRLLWENWQQFMGERKGPDDDPEDYTMPQATVDLSAAAETLGDYLGLPIGQTGVVSVNDLPFRCYDLIWYEWYRDQNIQVNATPTDTGPGPTDRTTMPLKRRNKRKDYFTSALPWPQKGDPVTIPIAQQAPVISTGDGAPQFDIGAVTGDRIGTNAGGDATGIKAETATAGGSFVPAVWNDPKLIADLQSATATTINDLRTAFQIQRLLERDARGGTRYIELVLSHFGVQSDDARQQRPEYLGAGTGMISVNPVASTYADQTEQIPQGNLSGVGTGLTKGGFNHSFTEHGIVMGIMSMSSDYTYQNGIERAWNRKTRYDHYWPALAHLGEQAILNQELFVSGVTEENEGTFGYQERYAEYRYKPGRIVGKFRSNDPASLDVWHLAQDFDTLPTLSSDFINELPPVGRVIAVPSEPHFLIDAWFDLKCTRPMPVYSVPGMIDHF